MKCPACNREMEHFDYQPADPRAFVRKSTT